MGSHLYVTLFFCFVVSSKLCSVLFVWFFFFETLVFEWASLSQLEKFYSMIVLKIFFYPSTSCKQDKLQVEGLFWWPSLSTGSLGWLQEMVSSGSTSPIAWSLSCGHSHRILGVFIALGF